MKQSSVYDVIVLGLGAMGSATLYQLSEQSRVAGETLRLLGVDQFHSPHEWGSSLGESRITRSANHRGQPYIHLAQRSQTLFQAIAKKTAYAFGPLYIPTGGILIGTTPTSPSAKAPLNSLEAFIACAKKADLEYTLWSSQDLKARFPQFQFPSNAYAYSDKTMGYLEPEACIKAQLHLAAQNGAEIRMPTRVTRFQMNKKGIVLLKDSHGQIYQTRHLVICAGAWLPQLLPPHASTYLQVTRQVQYWFEVKPSFRAAYQPHAFPVFIWYLPHQQVLYGFPRINGKTSIKLAAETVPSSSKVISPETVSRDVTPAEIKDFYEQWVAPYLVGLERTCVKAKVCLYTETANGAFWIDEWPESNSHIHVVSPCSGHGFKHSAALGEALATDILEGPRESSLLSFFKTAYLAPFPSH